MAARSLALVQIDDSEIHDIVYDALWNDDLAKRIGFKKLFIEHMLHGDKSRYDEITEAFAEELSDCNRFDYWEMVKTYDRVLEERGEHYHETPSLYHNFANAVYAKVRGLNLQKECVLLDECRSLLTAYDDFNYGIHMNHELYKGLEQRYESKMAALQAGYEGMISRLLALAVSQGISLQGIEQTTLLDTAGKE